MKKYWIGFALVTGLALFGIYWMYFRKKKTTVAETKSNSSPSKGTPNLGIKNDGIEVGSMVYESEIGAITLNYGGNSRGANITSNINLNNVALRYGYSYTIEQNQVIGEESTEVKLFLNGKLIDWVSIDWVIGNYAHIPVSNASNGSGGGTKDAQEQGESVKGNFA